MKPLTIMIAGAAIILAACASQKDLIPSGGSRADGAVQMSYEYGLFESPVVDMGQGTAAAGNTCHGWGYSGAQPFGGQTRKCLVRDDSGGGCVRMQVTVQFQCTGAPSAAR